MTDETEARLGNLPSRPFYPPALVSAPAGYLKRLLAVEKAARALLADVHHRYPGEPLRCPFMQALEDALDGTTETDLFQEILCPTVE